MLDENINDCIEAMSYNSANCLSVYTDSDDGEGPL